MKRTILADCITYFFILLFAYTGAAKLAEVHQFNEQLTSSPLLGSIAGVISWALPIGELLLAIGLLIPATRLKALYATFGLMSLFTIYVIVLLFIDKHISCSCGGIVEELTPTQHIIFNSACVILSILGILIVRRQQPTSGFRLLTGGSAICLFLMVGWTLFTAFTAPVKRKTGKEGRLLPQFELLFPDSVTHFTADEIPTGKPFIVFGFDPYCNHCQAETKDIEKHIDQFKGVHIYYITPYTFKAMKQFYHHFKIAQYPGITMGHDLQAKFFIYFHITNVPFVAIYDSHKRLKEVFQNSTSVEQLLQAAAE
jgi:hypothetical protein